jgi:hypothetical protein
MSSDLRFAVIGDYGGNTQAESDVARMVQSWQPAFVTTAGDNNYPTGMATTIDQNIGQFYHSFLSPYNGNQSLYGPGAADGQNHFFPALGGSDWGDTTTPNPTGDQPYLKYFQGDLPSGQGGGRYYDVTIGNVELFVIDSNFNEPDGTASTSAQAVWLQGQLQSSTAQWKVVVDHTPPFSSGIVGNSPSLQWPFKTWGATAVISGQDHDYERLFEGGLPYFVDGLGGESVANFPGAAETGSQARYNADYGAMLIDATAQALTFQFVSRTGQVIDTATIAAPGAPAPKAPPAPSGLTATAVSPTQVNLAWTDNATGESGFRVLRSTDGVNFQQIAQTASGVTTYQDTAAVAGTTYFYRVRTVLNTTAVSSAVATELDSTTFASASTTTTPLPTTAVTYLSNLTPDPSSTSTTSPLVSNNTSYFDNPMSLKGVGYSTGLGVHSISNLVYNLNGQFSLFLADIGIDDEQAGNPASVDMQVFGDGKLLYDSGLMLANSPTQHVDVNMSGVSKLTLFVNDGGDGTNHDSADWAAARVFGATAQPTTTALPTGPSGANGWYTGPVSVSLAATSADYPSSALTTTYSLDNGPTQSYTAGQSIAISGDGTHTLTFQSQDPGGATETPKTLTFLIDATPPVTTAKLAGSVGTGGVYVGPVTVTLTATDAISGVASTSYSLDGAKAQTYAGPFTVTSAGNHNLSFFSTNKAGDVEAVNTLGFTVASTTAPTTVATPSGPAGTNGWYTGPVGVTLSATDPNYPSSALTTTFSLDKGTTQSYTSGQSIAISGDGTHTLTFQSQDPGGATETLETLTVKIDATPPVTTAKLAGSLGTGGVYVGAVTVTLTATDAISGIASTSYSLDGTPAQTYSGPFTVTSPGTHTLSFFSTNKAGDVEAANTLGFTNVASSAPTTVATPTGPAGTNGWYTGAVSVSLSATDQNYPSSALTTTFSLDNGPTKSYTAGQSIAISRDGTHTLTFQSKDPAGATESPSTLTVKIDTTPPVTTAALAGPTGVGGVYIGPVTVTLKATDSTSGVAATYYVLDGAAQQAYSGSLTVSAFATHNLSFYSADQAGNTETSHSLTFTIAQAPPFNNSIGVLVLDPSRKGALNVQDNGSIIVNGGAIAINSTNPSGGQVGGNGTVSGAQIFDSGGLATAPTSKVTGTVVSQLPTADPLSGLAPPPTPTTTFPAVNYTGSKPLTLSPGTYVGGIKLNGSGLVTLQPGIYYMQGGGFSIGGSATVQGFGVMIYNAPVGPSDAISFHGQGLVLLTPMTSGLYQGITFFQAPNSTNPIQIGNQEIVAMTGMIYAPAATLKISDHAKLLAQDDPTDSIKARVIVADLSVSGNGVLDINPFGNNPVSVGLVADVFGWLNPNPTNP